MQEGTGPRQRSLARANLRLSGRRIRDQSLNRTCPPEVCEEGNGRSLRRSRGGFGKRKKEEKNKVLNKAQYSFMLDCMARKGSKKVVASHYLTGEVARLSGLSKHMIDYLCRHGLLTASMSGACRGYGRHRKFSFTDVLLAKSIGHLLQADVSIMAMRKALATLRDVLHRDVAEDLRDHRVVIKGGVPLLIPHGAAPINLLAKGQLTFGFILEAEDLWRRAERERKQRLAMMAARMERAAQLRKERVA